MNGYTPLVFVEKKQSQQDWGGTQQWNTFFLNPFLFGEEAQQHISTERAIKIKNVCAEFLPVNFYDILQRKIFEIVKLNLPRMQSV